MTALLLDKLSGARIAVIGDVMVDHYVVGEVSRISPEAPVPVLLVQSERHTLGGAANVAANIASFGGYAIVVGVVGEDPMGRLLAQLIDAHAGAIEARLCVSNMRPTIAKTRYMGGAQQILRADRELAALLPDALEARLMEEIEAAILASEVVVLSDYGKGVLTDGILTSAIGQCRRLNKPCIVDPKRTRLSDYRGATYITPNRRELSEAVRAPTDTDDEAAAAAAVAIEQTDAAILLTRSEKGMTLYRRSAPPVHLSTGAKEVFDVSGAGDTVVAALAAGLAASLSVEEAMSIANSAAGIVVGKVGTAVASRDELAAAMKLSTRRATRDANIVSLHQAQRLRERWRTQGLVVGLVHGCFDLLHPGHMFLLAQAAAECDRLIVALNSDSSARYTKGTGRPVQTLPERAAVLAAIRGVDIVISFDESAPFAQATLLKPDVMIFGSARTEEDQRLAAASGGARVVLVTRADAHSTSGIIERIGRS